MAPAIKRRKQFSLRKLLALVVALAVLLPCLETLVHAVHEARQRARTMPCTSELKNWSHACDGRGTCPMCRARE